MVLRGLIRGAAWPGRSSAACVIYLGPLRWSAGSGAACAAVEAALRRRVSPALRKRAIPCSIRGDTGAGHTRRTTTNLHVAHVGLHGAAATLRHGGAALCAAAAHQGGVLAPGARYGYDSGPRDGGCTPDSGPSPFRSRPLF
jgi:hypothetical protein